MSSVLFDVGDEQRMEREAALTEQLPRHPIVDRLPSDSMMMDASREADEFQETNELELMLRSLLEALEGQI